MNRVPIPANNVQVFKWAGLEIQTSVIPNVAMLEKILTFQK